MKVTRPALSTIAALPANDEALYKVATVFHPKTSADTRKMFLMTCKDMTGLMWFGTNGKLQYAIFHELIVDSNHQVIGLMASYSGDLKDSSPIVLDKDILGQCFISVISSETAKAAGITTLSDGSHNPINAKDKDNKPLPDDITFLSDDPIFALLPQFCPIIAGMDVPLGLDATQDLPPAIQAQVDALHPFAKAFIQGQIFAWQKLLGNSLYEDETLIGRGSIPLNEFHLNNVKVNVNDIALAATVGFDFTMSPVGSEGYMTYKRTFRHKADDLSRSLIDLDNLPTDTASSPSSTDALGIVKATIEAVTKSKDDPIASEELERSLRFYEILFATPAKNENGEIIGFEPAKLSDTMKKVLKAKKPTDAHTLLHDYWTFLVSQRAGTRNLYDSLYDWNEGRMTTAFVAALRSARWLDKSIAIHGSELKTQLGLPHFIPSDTQDKELRSLIETEEEATHQGEIDVHQSLRKVKSTKFHIKGRCTDLKDVKSTIANFVFFAKFALDKFSIENPPYLIHLFDSFMDILCSQDVNDWENCLHDKKQVPVTFIQELSTVVIQCVRVAKDINNRATAAHGTIHNPRLFSQAELHLSNFTGDFKHAVNHARIHPLNAKPPLADFITTTTTDSEPKNKGKDKDKAKDASTDKGTKRTQATSDTEPAKLPKGEQDNTKKGILICTDSTGKLPMPDLKSMNRGKERPYCADFLYLNHQCEKRNCPAIHMGKKGLDNADNNVKTVLCQFVDSTPNVQWAPGCKPSLASFLFSSLPTAPKVFSTLASLQTRLSSIINPLRSVSQRLITNHQPEPNPTIETPSIEEILEPFEHEEIIVSPRINSLMHQGADVTPSFANKKEAMQYLLTLDPRYRLAVENPNGKDSLDRCFMTERTFHNVYIFLFKSNYLSAQDLRAFCHTFRSALYLWMLFKSHELVDFRSLQSPLPTDLPANIVMHRWSRMFTACLLHYNLDVATAVRFVGGIHTGNHRDWDALEPHLRAAAMDAQLISDLRRVLVDGCPNYVNAYSTDANRRQYAEYGNHPSVYKYPDQTKKAVEKDFMRSHNLTANPLLATYLPDTQLIPQGLVIVDGKPDRQICDSSFHPKADSIAVNDMTTKETEQEVIFPRSFTNYLSWIYNLRIDYPQEDIYLGDDDVSGAFRHAKWNPNVVGMHAFMLFGFLFFCTGLTFGDTTCPGNWEVVAISRMMLAAYLWTQSDTITKVMRFLPEITMAPPPSQQQIANFTPATRDAINRGVHNPDGSRRPPNFDHHVDDCLYADVAKYLILTISSSVLALYLILGFPNPKKGVRDCVSWDKFTSTFTHRRKALGWIVDSRELTVSLPEEKKSKLLQHLHATLKHPELSLRQLAQLLGLLSSSTTVCRHMRCSYFNLQRLIRDILVERFRSQVGYHKRRQLTLDVRKTLPSELHHRLQGIVSRHMARLLWNSSQNYKLNGPILRELKFIVHSLKTEEWKIYIPHLIPRSHHFESLGDASETGGGAFSMKLSYWFRLLWSPQIIHGTRLAPSHPGFIHINTLEFLVAFLQVVAAVVLLESAENDQDLAIELFPSGLPAFPILQNGTDNTATKAWVNNCRTTSPLVRALVDLYGQLLKRSNIQVCSEHVPDVSQVSLDAKVSKLPAQCRATLGPAFSAVMHLQHGPPKSTKDAGTIFSHRVHFFRFLDRLKWPKEDFFLEKVDQETRTMILASYAVDLAQGNTIKGKPIRAQTIDAYLRHVATLLVRYCDRDPRFDQPTDQRMSPLIHGVLEECKRYEQKNKRLDPYTLEMHETFKRMNRESHAPFLGLLRAQEDWYNFGLYMGYRKREWAQDDQFRHLDNPELAPNSTDSNKICRAITLGNIKFFNSHGQPIQARVFLRDRSSVFKAIIKFPYQKNKENGEERSIVCNSHNPDLCGIRALHSIIKRFSLLVDIDNTTTPLAVYRDDNKETLFIHSSVITKTLRAIARETYNLTETELAKHYRYSSHSIRIGACVLLHSCGANAIQLKFLLRWKSDAFMEYLRNIPLLSVSQNKAFAFILPSGPTDAQLAAPAAMPNLI